MPTLPFCASSCIAVEKFSLSAGSHSLRNAFLIGAGDLAPKHSRVFAAGEKNNESNCCNFAPIFPRGLSSELFISPRLLVITDPRPRQVSGQPSFMDICLLSCPDL